jgi:hypothetical protein
LDIVNIGPFLFEIGVRIFGDGRRIIAGKGALPSIKPFCSRDFDADFFLQ